MLQLWHTRVAEHVCGGANDTFGVSNAMVQLARRMLQRLRLDQCCSGACFSAIAYTTPPAVAYKM